MRPRPVERRPASDLAELRAALGRIARVPQLLVACDYDGTLAPLVDDPTKADAAARGGRRPPGAGRAPADHGRGGLRPGAARPGRAVPAAQRGPPRRQPRLRVRRRLRPAARRPSWSSCARRLRDELREIVRGQPGRPPGDQAGQRRACTSAESTRQVAADARRGASAAARRPGPTSTSPTARRSSSCRWSPPTRAPRSTRCARSCRPARCSSSATTSPTRTRSPSLHGPDVGIKIGAGDDAGATTGSADPTRRSACSALLLETRRRWLFGEHAVPIERHSMLANGSHRRAAHARRQGDAGCATPRPDSAAIFADLLGGARAGLLLRRPGARRHPARASATGRAR